MKLHSEDRIESPSRRSILKASAWAAPAILLAAAAPAYAASQDIGNDGIRGVSPGKLVIHNTSPHQGSHQTIAGNYGYRVEFNNQPSPMSATVLVEVYVSHPSIGSVLISSQETTSLSYEVISFKDITSSGKVLLRPGNSYEVTFMFAAYDNQGRLISEENGQNIRTHSVTIGDW